MNYDQLMNNIDRRNHLKHDHNILPKVWSLIELTRVVFNITVHRQYMNTEMKELDKILKL